MLIISTLSLVVMLNQYQTVKGSKAGYVPKLVELASDEKRDIHYYERTAAIRDLGLDDQVRRCELV